MLTKKKLQGGVWAVLLLAVALTGCTPAGPRALLDGKKLIEQGKYDAAVERLKTATELMDTNALAWNYLGLAYHHANQPERAIEAYQKALKRNPDLIEVHYDLGCVLLDIDKPEQLETARGEFTAYTLRRPKSLPGWLKLGTTQLRLGELAAAEKSFNEARRIDERNPEALNDMGVVLLRRNNPRDAAAYFNSALAQKPDYSPALLNLANVSQYHLNNRKLALQKYQEYLALNPRPANWDAVNITMRDLDRELNPPAAPPVNPPATHTPPPTNIAKIQTNAAPKVAVAVAPRPEPPQKLTVAAAKPVPEPEIVNVPTETAVPVANDVTPTSAPNAAAPSPNRSSDVLLTEPVVASPPADSTATPPPQKRGFFQKINPMNLFHRDQKPTDIPEPLPKSPAVPEDSTKTVQVVSIPEPAPAPPPPPQPAPKPLTLTRYTYRSPSKPPSGDRAEAERLFTQGLVAYKDRRLKDALTDYRAAARADGSYFEAQFNAGLAAFELDELPESLLAYETALAINPRSFNARFNFSLALKKAGYIQDAATELERVLVICPPDEQPEHLAMAHLTLANLYSEQFHQPSAARPHYEKVLELDPRNSQATAIRYWLRDNS